jgi:hypothetical protein
MYSLLKVLLQVSSFFNIDKIMMKENINYSPCPIGTFKHYSIDEVSGLCGECCINPKKYREYKRLEKGLTPALTNTPCYSLGYTKYQRSENRGIWPVLIKVDIFSLP